MNSTLESLKQILTNFRTGEVVLETVPAPAAERGEILIRTRRTLVSQGTERMLVQFGRASLLEKVRQQPAKVREVLTKMRSDGIGATLSAVRRKMDEPLPLGYCHTGVVIGVGEGIAGFAVGDRVVSNGPHAEIVSVPQNLVAKVPAGVSDDAAAFTVIGAIGLQGMRLAKPELGECFAVIGLGLIGQMVVQLLCAHGCRVIGFDFDPAKVETARGFGVEASVTGGEVDPVRRVLEITGGAGVDGVIITASTSSDDVVAQAAHMCRKRGRIVLVGVVGLNLNRADFYEKELSFQVSCSYGPGRYESAYEEKGCDYPIGFVRWTENRNFQAVLGAMATGALRVESLITKRVPLARFAEIYDNMSAGGLASLLIYEDEPAVAIAAPASPGATGAPFVPVVTATFLQISPMRFASGEAMMAVVGAGNFTKMTAMPALAAARAPIKVIVSSGGVTGTMLAKKYGVPCSGTDYGAVLADAEIRAVILTTRHHLHARQSAAALRARKHVLVEKPLCLSLAELREIEAARIDAGSTATAGPWVTVGYNRRFSPHVEKMKSLLAECGGPVSMVATINAGAIPPNHWVHDPEIGGGRLVGEACHFVDLAIHLTGSEIVSVAAQGVGSATDCASVLLAHANGSTSVINYFSHGHRELSKERIEAHAAGRSLVLDNFRELRGYGFRSFGRLRTGLDKGHARQFSLFAERVRAGGPALIPWAEVANSTRATLGILRALSERRVVALAELA